MTNPEPAPQKRRGCFFYGCVTCLVLFFVIGVAGFLVVRHFANALNELIVQYTDTAPMALTKVDMPADELKQLQARFDAFSKAAEAHSNTPPLVLTSREINALLANDPDMKSIKDKFYVSLEGEQVKGQISLPLEQYFNLPLIHTKGRYLNGSGTFDVGVTNALLFVSAQSLEVKGKPLPAQFMASLRGQNLATNVNNNPTNATFISRLESLQVTNGTAVLKAKPN